MRLQLPREIVYDILMNYIPSKMVRTQMRFHKLVIDDIRFIREEEPLLWFWREPNLFIFSTRFSERRYYHVANIYDYLLRSKDVVF